jgi:transposase-like protein
MKTVEREQARALRASRGMSIKEIARLLGVSRSSVSLWVRDIELTLPQHEALRQRNPIYNRQLAGRSVAAAKRRAERVCYQAHGQALARRGDPFHAAGCMLFWAEGSKHRNTVHFSNSDPEMVRFFLRFLRSFFDVRDEQVRVWCNLYADHAARQEEIEEFWLEELALPRTCLTKSTVNSYSKNSQRKRLNMLPYGTCRVSVHSTRVVQSLFGSIQQYADFSRRDWLG